ncbi:cytochrome P450 [Streptomyces sp. NPDC089915]|uniref:cytochrome P450 n=1 Tax=Streptomyces sp. NPDC089915 TaxID=3155186 RepID=UPI0034279863
MVTSSQAGVPDPESAAVPFFPIPRASGCPLDPAPELAALQERAPLVRVRLWDGSTPWLVTRHAEQCALLSDRRVSADWTQPGYPFDSPFLRDHHEEARFLTAMEGPEHLRLRRMIARPFTPRRVGQLRPAIRQVVDDHIDALLAGPKPADFVSQFALPIPCIVICHVLGVPYEDHDFFQHAIRTLTARDVPDEVAGKAEGELYRYLARLIGRKLRDPGDDLLSQLAAERLATRQLNRHELVMLVLFLLVSGHETTASMIALGTLALLLHPDQIDVLKEADDRGAEAAVDELLRYLTTVQPGRRRVAVEDVEIAGQVVRAGEGLILPEEIGNRDERVFPAAAALDLRRDAGEHLAFGFGVHKCTGQPLARLELQVVFAALFRRIPTLALAVGVGDLPFMDDGLGYGLREMPVSW